MSHPIVYGDAISTYVRSVRLALEEKGVPHDLVAVDLIKGEQKSVGHLARNPWGKMPAFEHEGHLFYESSAIVRYIDAAFSGPALMPAGAVGCIRVNQARMNARASVLAVMPA